MISFEILIGVSFWFYESYLSLYIVSGSVFLSLLLFRSEFEIFLSKPWAF